MSFFRRTLLACIGLFLLFATHAAEAQFSTGKVVPNCGGQQLVPGGAYPFTIDPSGAPCPPTSTPGVAPLPCAWTYTSVTLAAATSATILAAGSYKAVVIMNMGANPLNRFASGVTPITATSPGFALDPPSSAQGGSYAFLQPPTTAVQAISTLGTTVTVGTCT